MNVGFGKCAMLLVLAVLFATLCFPGASGADLVLPGYDLLETSPGTTFGGVAFHGVPLGTFDFGGTIGVKNVGNTDLPGTTKLVTPNGTPFKHSSWTDNNTIANTIGSALPSMQSSAMPR